TVAIPLSRRRASRRWPQARVETLARVAQAPTSTRCPTSTAGDDPPALGPTELATQARVRADSESIRNRDRALRHATGRVLRAVEPCAHDRRSLRRALARASDEGHSRSHRSRSKPTVESE